MGSDGCGCVDGSDGFDGSHGSNGFDGGFAGWFGAHLLHPTLHIKPFVLLLFRCPLGTVLLVMVGLDHMAVGVDVAAGVESQKYAPMSNGSARSAVLETGGVVRIADTLCECHERRCGYPADLGTGENCCPGEDASWYGRRRAYFGWQESFGEKNSKNSKESSMARRKRQSTSRPNKIGSTENPHRLESESAKLAEWQESLRVRKETLRVAYEEIKILREDLLRERNRWTKNKSHFMSPENTEEIRILEQQELAFWRGSASKRLAGWDSSAPVWGFSKMESETLSQNRIYRCAPLRVT